MPRISFAFSFSSSPRCAWVRLAGKQQGRRRIHTTLSLSDDVDIEQLRERVYGIMLSTRTEQRTCSSVDSWRLERRSLCSCSHHGGCKATRKNKKNRPQGRVTRKTPNTQQQSQAASVNPRSQSHRATLTNMRNTHAAEPPPPSPPRAHCLPAAATACQPPVDADSNGHLQEVTPDQGHPG